ncbi:MAG: hypothetical protein E7602_03270 [Ruminococcaceae bacterium]|nr:hypothetical protein [Oscillospiraceae bacterium]
MKKIILINVLTLVLTLLLLCGCHAPLNTDTETDTETEDATDTLDGSDTEKDSSSETETATDESASDSSTETSKDEPIPDVEDAIIEMNNLLVTYNGEYTVTICDGQRKVVFDKDGNVTKCVNITLIEDIKFDYTYRIKSIDQIKAELGEPHVDIGKSGEDYIYTPSYVTNDGFLISFILDERNNANSAEKIDLFSGDIVDWIEIDYTPVETDTSTDTSTEIENPKTPSENTQTVTWQFNYDYGFHHENSATLLIDYGRLIHGFENVIIPDDIVAGDSITIEYTGGISIAESYPSGIYLHDGEVISYSFKYASVVPFSLTKTSIERLREEYDIAEEYVIVDRSGKYQTLEESIGKTIYLVTDQKKVSEHPNNWGFPADKYPISSMFAFNPRDLKVGISPVEPRNEKVVFDLDYHHLSNELIEKEEDKTDPTKFYCGYICKDENGNEFIAYAPNLYSYTVLIECTEDKSLAYDWINNVLTQFNPWYSTGRCDVEIDTQDLPNDMILITFPDFDTYFTCQNDLLNKLSVLECVKKIHITYVDAQNGTYFPKNPYVVYADVGSKYYKNDVFTTYDEFTSALGSCIESSLGLQAITESTFENNYVFVVTNWHWRELKISDARAVGDTVYFTNNEFQGKGELHDMLAYENSCVIVVPKDEIGELPENVSVKTVNTTIYVDGFADYGDAEGAIIIALEHFSSSDKQALPEGYIYKAKAVDRKYDYCHYVLIYPEYVGDSDSIVDVWGGGYLYAIDKFTKEIVSVEILE